MLLLLALAVVGHTGRLLLGREGQPPGELLSDAPLGQDPSAQRTRAEQVSKPLRPGEKVDLNTARVEEIARLPRIGMSLAKRIVETRTSRGRFRGPEDLDRVPGVGRALLTLLEDRVSYGTTGGPESSRSGSANLSSNEGYGVVPAPGSEQPVDLNSASEQDLLALPGIGKGRARAILAYRRSHGSFAAVSDLGLVPGFSRALVERLGGYLVVR